MRQGVVHLREGTQPGRPRRAPETGGYRPAGAGEWGRLLSGGPVPRASQAAEPTGDPPRSPRL